MESSIEMTQDSGRLQKGSPRNKFHIPCPVLEFRIVNRLFHDVGGEIMDATLHAVANVDAAEHSVHSTLGDWTESTRQQRSETGSNTDTNSDIGYDTSSYDTGSDTGSSHLHGRGHITKFIETVNVFSGGKKNQQTIEEDPSARLVGKRIFSKMIIEASEHPFFKRVWLARHILDDSSPLLTHKTRRAIRRNGGFWPAHLNNYEAVRNSLYFNQILVSLNGVSNVSAADVYAQKIYDIVDVNIGYQFVNLLYRDPKDHTLKVDTTLINDVREQNGGGGEPLLLGE